MQKTIEQRIRSGYGDMRKSEQRAADYILDHLNHVRELSLDRLANEAEVSQPTVIRMLKALGFKGYREFRDQLLREYARDEEGEGRTTPLYGYPLHKGERLEDIPRNMTAMTERMLQETLKNFSVKTYKQIVEVLKHARIIDIYSVENSEVTAQDFVAKLLYLGFSCRHFGDHYYQRIAAGSLTSEDVAVGISYSGSSKDTVDVMKTAKKSGGYHDRADKFQGFPHQQICRLSDLYQPGAAVLWRCHIFQSQPALDRRYDLYGDHRIGL